MISLDVALDRLLHKPSVLAAFLARGPAALDVSAEDAAALATIDTAELAATARQILTSIFKSSQRGSGDLLALYPRTFAANGGTREQLAAAFLESRAFDAYRDVPFAGAGCCLEEAFYRFAEEHGLGEPVVREGEFLAAIIKALVVCVEPDFIVPAEVLRAPGGSFAVTTRAEPTLYAALGGRYVTGPITPFLAELLRSPDAAEEVARRHGVAPEVLVASVEHLTGLGLLERAQLH